MAISIKQLFPSFNPETKQVNDINFRNQSKIVELFRYLKEEKTVLKIRLPDTKKEFSSSVVDIDEKNLYFTLNELYPEDGHAQFSRCGKLIAHAQIRGANVSFDSSLIQADRPGQFIHYLCDIPDSISYVQRRLEYRVKIKPTHLIQVTTQHQPSRQVLTGNVQDISLKGIGIVFDAPHIIKPGDQLLNCKLPLSNSDIVNFSLQVRHIESTSPNKIHVGGNFIDPDPLTLKLIARFVREMERMTIRR